MYQRFIQIVGTRISLLVILTPLLLLRSVVAQDDTAAAPESSLIAAGPGQERKVHDRDQLRKWLENMVWFHQFSMDEIRQVTGLTQKELDSALDEFDIQKDNKPQPNVDPLITVLPYPGGRHPRIGFLDGAIEPQRETKLSIFAPWDQTSYLVLDAPEAIWSNLGLTYLAHTHIDTIWTKQDITLPQLEWQVTKDGSYQLVRPLPNGISYTVTVTPHRDHVAIEMSLTNGTEEMLTDLRVQMCGMLRGLKSFDSQTNDNKVFRGSLAACANKDRDRWVILGFEPNHRTWANAPCPCIHSDPVFPDCPPGETRFVHGRISFYTGKDIDSELLRIDNLWNPTSEVDVIGQVFDSRTGQPVACRMYVQGENGEWFFAEPADDEGIAIRYEKQNWVNSKSQEFHTCLSGDPFKLRLKPGTYQLTVERGKEYFPWSDKITVGDDQPQPLKIEITRWINMAEKDWYSGDTHVHRQIRDLGIPMLADDLNVAFPMVYWTSLGERTAANGDRTNRDDAQRPSKLIMVDDTHVIWPKNTEWEIFKINDEDHTLGAVFALNHKTPFDVAIPPVSNIIQQAETEDALFDMDKHDWPFSMVLPAVLKQRLLFELANNHMWRTDFGFSKWSTPAPDWMNLGDGKTGDEKDWVEFTHRTYWCLLNCGYRLQPTAGTATGVHPVPIGYGRVYVQTPGGFDYGKWIEGLRNGRSFVTTGPMLFIESTQRGLQVEVRADGPIESFEWIVNGEVVEITIDSAQQLNDGTVRFSINLKHNLERTSWVAVRVWQKSPEGKWRFAHSAPIWFDMPGKPIVPSDEQIQYLIRRMEQERQRSQMVISDAASREYDDAIEQYRQLKTEAVMPR